MMSGSLFVLGVVTHDDRYLVVQERDSSWYLPAGKVEAGESLVAALVRETVEEAGQRIAVRGLLGVDHVWWGGPNGSFRLRFVFVGARAVLLPPKDRPDRHSLGAAWLPLAEIRRLRLRHPEVLDWIRRWEEGPVLMPTSGYQWVEPSGS